MWEDTMIALYAGRNSYIYGQLVFRKVPKLFKGRKGNLFLWENWIYTCQKLALSLTSHHT